MRLFSCLLCLFIIQTNIKGQTKEITLEDVFEKGIFRTKGIGDFDFRNDGISFTRMVGNKIIRYSIESGKELEIIFNAETDAKELVDQLSDYEFSTDEQFLILKKNIEHIYRYSSVAETYIFNLKKQQLTRIFPKGKIMYPQMNNASNKIAFVFENNLYFYNLQNQKYTQVTKDGKKNEIINGASDWVYEEEFTLTRTFEWSPSGDQLAYLRFDESRVKEFSMEYYNDQPYPKIYTFKYPKVGEENSKISLWNYNTNKRKSKLLNTGTSLNDDIYIPRIQWTSSNTEVCMTWMNRSQNELKLILIDTKNNTRRILLEEKNKYYIDLHDNLRFTKDGKYFLWTSEQSGYNQLYRYNMDGKLQNAITTGTLELTEFYGMNESESVIYFQRAENRGLERKVYSIGIDGSSMQCLTDFNGVNNAKISKAGNFIIISKSSLTKPPTHQIIDSKGNVIRLIEDNKDLKLRLEKYQISNPELISINNSHGESLNSIMIKPQRFDEMKKYPVFMFLYGGPGSQQVMNRWSSFSFYWWHQMLAQKDYIVCVVDNRGTGGRGEEFKKLTYKQLGKYETEDQIDAAKYLGSLPFVDSKRIGIFGWSYGGYMSSLCLLKGNDVFKSAIAVAPVTNWKWYDNIYTERYMGDEKNNKQSYLDNSPVYFAHRLKGNYLLIHGLADDNVHFQNSAEMAKELIKNKKQFDTYYYPNRNHGISGDNATIHLFTKITNFVIEKL